MTAGRYDHLTATAHTREHVGHLLLLVVLLGLANAALAGLIYLLTSTSTTYLVEGATSSGNAIPSYFTP